MICTKGFASTLLLLTAALVLNTSSSMDRPATIHPQIVPHRMIAPISFEPNVGQTNSQGRFLSRFGKSTMLLSSNESVLLVGGQPKQAPALLKMQLVGAASGAEGEGLGKLTAQNNYFLGNDAKQWITDVPTYSSVRFQKVYPGIDVVYHSRDSLPEFDFVVSPGSNPDVIRIAFEGMEQLSLNSDDDLILKTAQNEVSIRKPRAYQTSNGVRHDVSAVYVIRDQRHVTFEIGDYDRSEALIIDPTITFFKYVGGASTDYANFVAIDTLGNVYVTGGTSSSRFLTVDPLQANPGGSEDAFVTKLTRDGTIVYSTYIGGVGPDQAGSVAVDQAGNVYITGQTGSRDFPTINALQPSLANSNDVFVTKISSNGAALVYSTFLGGSSSDAGNSITVDRDGNAYVTGSTESRDFPVRRGAQIAAGFSDAFVFKVNPEGSELVYSTYLGGSGTDLGAAITIDSDGNACITGWTDSRDFPVINASVNRGIRGGLDVFVTKLTPDAFFLFSTTFGGSSSDRGYAIATDRWNNIYIAGDTSSSNLPVTNPFQARFGGYSGGIDGAGDALVAKLTPNGSALIYLTYLGSTGADRGTAISVNGSGEAYVAGWTDSAAFPIANAVQPAVGPSHDAFITRFSASGKRLIYSTYFGGAGFDEAWAIAVDSSNDAYVAGRTSSTFFAALNPPLPISAGGVDAFVLGIENPMSESSYDVPDRGGFTVTTGANSSAAVIGYGKVQPANSHLRQNGILLSEASVPASSLTRSGRMFVEESDTVRTGVAIANPNPVPATISFSVSDSTGINFAQGTVTIPANGQIARFLDEPPFSVPGSTFGTWTFSSSTDIAVLGMRGRTNERSEFLMTTLAVSPLTATSGAIIVPHFAAGGGWTTELVLFNPTDQTLSGSFQFLDQGSSSTPAQPIVLPAESFFSYRLPPRGVRRFETAGVSSNTQAGSIRITPDSNTQGPAAFAALRFKNSGITVSEVGVPAVLPGAAWRVYLEAGHDSEGAETGSIQSGLAIANPSDSPAGVSIELSDLDGRSLAAPVTLQVPARGQIAQFIGEMMRSAPSAFQGVVRVSTVSAGGVSVLGIHGRYNKRGDFLMSLTPASDENRVIGGNELIFPHLVDGGGYTTQLILFNNRPSTSFSGAVRFFSQMGTPLPLLR
ncbi:MAG: hypothetical protein DMG13_27805 [Acidobacteria bacterium]|nr:MAG: hypothetical protein DMG13_27805 [Acidobacteriota bacterium]